MLQAAAGSIGSAAGQTSDDSKDESRDGSGDVFGLPPWEAALAAAAACLLGFTAACGAAWLWRRRRHSAKR